MDIKVGTTQIFKVDNLNIPVVFRSNEFNNLGTSQARQAALSAVQDFVKSLKRNGIDRLDSTQGYVNGNCVTCCGRCNEAKMSEDLSEFVLRCNRIVQRHLELANKEEVRGN